MCSIQPFIVMLSRNVHASEVPCWRMTRVSVKRFGSVDSQSVAMQYARMLADVWLVGRWLRRWWGSGHMPLVWVTH